MEQYNNCPVVLYTAPDGTTQLDVKLENETVWLTQSQMALLFDVDRTSILRHIRNIYKSEELDEVSTCRKFRQVEFSSSSPSAYIFFICSTTLLLDV